MRLIFCSRAVSASAVSIWFCSALTRTDASDGSTSSMPTTWAAMVALFFACRRIWRPATDCAPGQVCAVPSVNRSYKLLFWVVVALVVLALGFPLIAPWFY